MSYGNKLVTLILFLSFFLLTGCSDNKNFRYELYDDYAIRSVNEKVKLYKGDNVFEINDLDYQIKEFKYNSDVVCLKLDDDNYYMIYYVDGEIYGPHKLEDLNETTENLSMTFDMDFKDPSKIEGLQYE